MAVRVELLGDQHDRRGFSCDVEALDRYLHQQAGQDVRRDLAVCYVLCEPSGELSPAARSVPIAGYYTLSATAIQPAALPAKAARRFGRYEAYPAILLGRLAVARRFRGQGYGKYLLLDAMRRSVNLSAQAGAIALVVDVIDEAAAGFYERFGFLHFQDAPLRLYLPMETCRRTIAATLRLDANEHG